jgi:hypothetical protein
LGGCANGPSAPHVVDLILPCSFALKLLPRLLGVATPHDRPPALGFLLEFLSLSFELEDPPFQMMLGYGEQVCGEFLTVRFVRLTRAFLHGGRPDSRTWWDSLRTPDVLEWQCGVLQSHGPSSFRIPFTPNRVKTRKSILALLLARNESVAVPRTLFEHSRGSLRASVRSYLSTLPESGSGSGSWGSGLGFLVGTFVGMLSFGARGRGSITRAKRDVIESSAMGERCHGLCVTERD